MKRHAGMHIQVAGICSSFELALRFTEWARGLHVNPSADMIRSQWNVSRATAYRWSAAWMAANGKAA